MNKQETFDASILTNHKIYRFEYDDVDEAIKKINIFRRYKKLFLSNHPTFKFTIDLKTSDNKAILTVETWIFPQLLNN